MILPNGLVERLYIYTAKELLYIKTKIFGAATDGRTNGC
jgi:hypothetical protein